MKTRTESYFSAVRTFPSCAEASGAAPRGGNSPLCVMQSFSLIKQPFPTKLSTAPQRRSVLESLFRRNGPQSAISGGRRGRAAAAPGSPAGRDGTGRDGAGAALRQRRRRPRAVSAERSGAARGQPRDGGSRRPSRPPAAGKSRARPGEREPETGRKEQPGRERPREASRQPGRSHFLPQVPFQVQLPLEDLGAILRLIRLLLQALDLPLDGFQGARRGHGRGADGGLGAEVLHVAGPRLSMAR